MPMREMDRDILIRKIRTPLIFGPPDSGKTFSLLTFPFEEDGSGDLVIVSCPGEEGYSTIPLNVPGIRSFIWEEPAGDPQTAASIVEEIHRTVFELISGMRGNVKILAIDGFHKLYAMYLNIVTNGKFGRGEEFEGKEYARSHAIANTFLRRFYGAPVPYKVLTCWNAREADHIDADTGKASRSAHEYPMVPGAMAKHIVGHAGLTIFAKVQYPRTPFDQTTRYWQLKPDNEVWGAAIKTDPRFLESIPTVIEPDWKVLEPLLLKRLEEE